MPEEKSNVLVETVSKAMSDVFSQSLGTPWTVVPVKDLNTHFSQVPSLVFQWVFAGALSGKIALEVSTEDCVLLAQKFLAQPNATAELSPEHKEALQELFRQIAGLAETPLRRMFGELSTQVSIVDSIAWPNQRVSIEASQSAETKVFIHLLVSDELSVQLKNVGNHGDSAELKEPASAVTSPEPPPDKNLNLVFGVKLALSLRFGQRVLSLRQILELNAGSVVELDREVHEPADLLLGDRLIARGEVVIVDGNYGLRVTEVHEANPMPENVR